ncbi:hypothetical protein EJ110_NYTH19225 [Nymphaea thermarum]|nr:hypothetical protein EJ110_NYTH19225 [Nymphaea thermarum]
MWLHPSSSQSIPQTCTANLPGEVPEPWGLSLLFWPHHQLYLPLQTAEFEVLAGSGSADIVELLEDHPCCLLWTESGSGRKPHENAKRKMKTRVELKVFFPIALVVVMSAKPPLTLQLSNGRKNWRWNEWTCSFLRSALTQYVPNIGCSFLGGPILQGELKGKVSNDHQIFMESTNLSSTSGGGRWTTKMMPRQKYYVVFEGHERGIYDSWERCQPLVYRYKGAVFKSFDSLEVAENHMYEYVQKKYDVQVSRPPLIEDCPAYIAMAVPLLAQRVQPTSPWPCLSLLSVSRLENTLVASSYARMSQTALPRVPLGQKPIELALVPHLRLRAAGLGGLLQNDRSLRNNTLPHATIGCSKRNLFTGDKTQQLVCHSPLVLHSSAALQARPARLPPPVLPIDRLLWSSLSTIAHRLSLVPRQSKHFLSEGFLVRDGVGWVRSGSNSRDSSFAYVYVVEAGNKLWKPPANSWSDSDSSSVIVDVPQRQGLDLDLNLPPASYAAPQRFLLSPAPMKAQTGWPRPAHPDAHP